MGITSVHEKFWACSRNYSVLLHFAWGWLPALGLARSPLVSARYGAVSQFECKRLSSPLAYGNRAASAIAAPNAVTIKLRHYRRSVPICLN